MSKKAFPINRVKIEPPKPVRVAPAAPIALPEREPRNIWVMIGVPALIVALIGTIVMLYVSGVRSLSTGFFPLMGIGAFSMLAFSGRFGRARKITWGEMEKGRRRYLRDLDSNRDEIQSAVCAQREWQNSVHSDPRGLGAIIGGPRMWERGRGDEDFLEVRLGTGVQHAPDSVLSVTWPDIASDEELEPVTGQALRDFILEQRKIRDIAKVVNLRSAPGFSFVGEDLDRLRSLMRSVLCSLAVFHNPRDVKLLVVTRNPEVWSWIVWLPHNLHDELFDACGWRRLVFATPEELEATLGAELHMKGKRGPWTPLAAASPTAMGSALETATDTVDLGPHLVIVDDNTGSPDAWESVVGQVGKAGITLLRIASRVGTGVGFAKDQVFELSERHSTPNGSTNGEIALRRNGSDADGEDGRPAPLLRVRNKFFAHADQLSIHRAYRYARAMARWSPTSRSEIDDSVSGATELLRALGISDPGSWTWTGCGPSGGAAATNAGARSRWGETQRRAAEHHHPGKRLRRLRFPLGGDRHQRLGQVGVLPVPGLRHRADALAGDVQRHLRRHEVRVGGPGHPGHPARRGRVVQPGQGRTAPGRADAPGHRRRDQTAVRAVHLGGRA